jgi:hypothetical protein
MNDPRMMILTVLLALAAAGCPFRWAFGHGHHHHDDDEPIACEANEDCDDGMPETLDSCTAQGACDARIVSYQADIQPVFAAKCAGCHVDSGTGTCAGGTCLATGYESLVLDSTACVGLSIAECAQARIKDGTMPRGRGCTGDPVMDAANERCLTAAEHALVDAWIAGGWQETAP